MRSFVAFLHFCDEYYNLRTGGLWSLLSKRARRRLVLVYWDEFKDVW